MADDHDDRPASAIPRGRIRRLGRLAGLASQVGAGLAADGVRKLLGGKAKGPDVAATKVLETLGTLKGAAMKAGQTLSLFADGLPPEARAIVGKLFSRAPTLPFEQIVQVFRADLGASPLELFAEFDEAPFAGASLGQVHAARLRSGEPVAVKIQYPGVAEALQDDLRNLSSLLRTVGFGGALLDAEEYVTEIRTEISGELDYTRELGFLEEFRGYLARWPDLVVPRAHPELCTRRVLVLERFYGPTLGELAQQYGLTQKERNSRGEQLVRAVMGPWIYERAVHADTHPGNYIALLDGRLGVLDFGSVKKGSQAFWEGTLRAVRSLAIGAQVDWVEVVRGAGFRWGIPDERLRKILLEMAAIAAEGIEAEYDFAQDTTIKKLADIKLRYPIDLLRVRAPAESLLFGRALGGLIQNLKALRSRLDLRPFLLGAIAEAGIGPER